MEDYKGQFLQINQQLSLFEDYINELTSTAVSSLDSHNNIIFSDLLKDSINQKTGEFFIDITKALCISVLCGEYIEFNDFFEKIVELEQRIEKLPNETNDFPLDIQSKIFGISSGLIIVIEFYKDFFRQIENYYSEERVQFLFKRNTQIQRELNKETLQSENEKIIKYFLNILNVTSIDHFPSTEDKYISELFKTEEFLENFKEPSFRDLTHVIGVKIQFLIFKWKERRLQENPLLHTYLENGIHKKIGDFETDNPKLSFWKAIISTQYELNQNGWKSILADRVKLYKNEEIKSINQNLKIHQLIKYYKDVNSSNGKLEEITAKLLDDKSKKLCENFYDKYAENVFCNYSLNNEFSNFIDEESSIEKINSKYIELDAKISDTTYNYFLKFKFLNKIFDTLLPKINGMGKESFIKDYDGILDKCKKILNLYRENINWSLINFNYIFLLPFNESKAKFRIDGVDYDIFFASSFVLPPSSKRIEDDYKEVKEKFDKLYSYLDFSKFFSNEIQEIKDIKLELSSKEIKSIELLSLFTAVISFIIGGISGFAFIKDLYSALLFFVVFTTSLLTFLIVLFVFTRGSHIIKENKSYIKWMYIIFISALFLLFISNAIKSKFLNNKTDIERIEERLKNDSIKESKTDLNIQNTHPIKIEVDNRTSPST